jgi:large subunit ribosomal protein L6
MSRIGKKPIIIPAGTDVKVTGSTLTVKGSGGTIVREFKPAILFEVVDGTLKSTPQKKDRDSEALWGTYASHAANMIAGVNKPFQKKLIIEGVGFKAEVKGTELVLNIGFSHQVKVQIPKDLKVSAEKGTITVSGINAELVGQFSAKVRDLKKPEPYKGKGIRYDNEVIRRKQGKKTA